MSYTPTLPHSHPYDPNTPPLPPPKPASHETSRRGSPLDAFPGRQLPFPLPDGQEGAIAAAGAGACGGYPSSNVAGGTQSYQQAQQGQGPVPDSNGRVPPPPGWDDEYWVPDTLKDKSIPDLSQVHQSSSLLSSLHSSPQTAHPATPSTQLPLISALETNVSLATNLAALERQLAHTRSATQSRLLALHGLERQWRAKQSDTDAALAPFSPKALYQRLVSAVAEQEQMCTALEESFLDHSTDGGKAGERETVEFVRRFREGRKVYYLRRERKERWDEGRVGGWR
ncbi:hypothetical protein FGG08_005588 [Glutinoglossum americanum]|uniref:VPS37 C-terminal domain-containing protein n=1 Tax=Glutinoglossum americanum TaxID=1670608 RepID=A0A9P8HXW6_9PEZI|nr:hypothetical protein FGG08_005588 [Glutinoglossum americanum]